MIAHGRGAVADPKVSVRHRDRCAQKPCSGGTRCRCRKLPYFARLWSNACLDETLSPAKLNYLVKLAEQLTYRQFVIISMAGAMARADRANLYALRETSYENADLNLLGETAIILSEILALHYQNCVSVVAPLGPTQIVPSEMRIVTHGATLYNAMELHRTPNGDCQSVADLLR